jgi:hypothetical protein
MSAVISALKQKPQRTLAKAPVRTQGPPAAGYGGCMRISYNRSMPKPDILLLPMECIELTRA